ncbi:MAG: LamB/YcsF family protein [Anaerolineaceae bacterium]|nr:LamB/YcsF family protein [Anaerolineaceae bacterium]
MKIDINCDMGESFGQYSLGQDQAMLPWITSANIACGFHASDPLVMQQTVQAANQAGVNIGAHPGYPDLQGFGRRFLDMTPEEVESMILYQIGALSAFSKSAGTILTHIKPHGALYNHAARDPLTASAIVKALTSFSKDIILVGLAGSVLVEMGQNAGLITANEGFPERAYETDGSLRSRRLSGAVIHSPQEAAEQALSLSTKGILITSGSQNSVIPINTLCVHGDSPKALNVVKAITEKLQSQKINIQPMKEIS